MLTSTRSTRLCYSCRFDLLRLFEHGFASPSPCCRPLISNPQTCRLVNRPFSQSCLRSNETPDERLSEEPRDLGAIERNQSLNKQHLELEQAKAIATKAKKKAEHQAFIALQQEAARRKQEAKERRTKLHEERKTQQQAEAEQRKLERQYSHEEREI